MLEIYLFGLVIILLIAVPLCKFNYEIKSFIITEFDGVLGIMLLSITIVLWPFALYSFLILGILLGLGNIFSRIKNFGIKFIKTRDSSKSK